MLEHHGKRQVRSRGHPRQTTPFSWTPELVINGVIKSYVLRENERFPVMRKYYVTLSHCFLLTAIGMMQALKTWTP
jgi:hypothetical protein